MEFRDLKRSVEHIKMSDAMRSRIIRNCRASTVQEREEITMKNKISFKKALPVAAVIVICLCVSVAAGSSLGYFRDITDWRGAVTGTEYVQAGEEIRITAAVQQHTLAVTAELLVPDAAPYSVLESLAVGSWRVLDMAGNVVCEGKADEFAEIVGGEARMNVPLGSVAAGTYRLLVSNFIGYKKADQPLKISGGWECVFTI